MVIKMNEEEEIIGHCETCNCAITETEYDEDMHIEFNDGYTAWVCGEWCREKLVEHRRKNN